MIPNIFSRLFKDKTSSSPSPSSAQAQAKKRLQLALLYDKLDVSDEMIQSLQKDMIAVLSRYFEIDHGALRLDITREDEGMSALVLNTPILSAKRMASPASVKEDLRSPQAQPPTRYKGKGKKRR